MQLFEDLVKCKNCMNNINNGCILYKDKDVTIKDTGCYVGIDKNNKQKLCLDVKEIINDKNK